MGAAKALMVELYNAFVEGVRNDYQITFSRRSADDEN